MRFIVDDGGPGRNAYIDRNRWGPFGTAFAHTAFVIIMAGFVVSSVTGFSDQEFALTIGHPKDVGHGTALVAEAKSFQDTYYEDGSPKDYVADLAIYDGGEEVANREVRINSPLSYDGVVFHQAYFGVAAVLTITDDSGAEVFHDGVALTGPPGTRSSPTAAPLCPTATPSSSSGRPPARPAPASSPAR